MQQLSTRVQRRLAEGARFFGLDALPSLTPPPLLRRPLDPHLLPAPGQMTVITGASGSGKSTLLRKLTESWTGPLLRVGTRRFKDLPVIALFSDPTVEATVARLARFGLAEASLLARRPVELSDGERFRLDLALTLATSCPERHPPSLIICDEFTSCLDEVTATSTASAVRRALTATPQLSALLATWREELLPTLNPEIHLHCDYGEWHRVLTENPLTPNPNNTSP